MQNSDDNSGNSAKTTIIAVPFEDHAQFAKQLGITEERLNTLNRVLEDAGISPREAPVRIPEMLAQLKAMEEQLDAAPKVGGRTDELRQKAEAALAEGDFDAADDFLRQAEEQDNQARHQLSDESQDRARAAAASAIARGDLANTRFKYIEAASHYLRAADHYPDTAQRDCIEALNKAGHAFCDAADFTLGEAAYTRARTLAETILDKNDPFIAIVLNNLIQLYQITNRLDLAEPLMERALTIDEKTFGPKHPNVAKDLNNLAQLYQTTKRLDLAKPLLERALAIDEKVFGPDHPNVARDLNNLAQLYQAINRLDLAEPLMERALYINEKVFGPDHPNVATCINNLAQIYQDTNRLDQAKALLERALNILPKELGDQHPDTERSRENLEQLLSLIQERNPASQKDGGPSPKSNVKRQTSRVVHQKPVTRKDLQSHALNRVINSRILIPEINAEISATFFGYNTNGSLTNALSIFLDIKILHKEDSQVVFNDFKALANEALQKQFALSDEDISNSEFFRRIVEDKWVVIECSPVSGVGIGDLLIKATDAIFKIAEHPQDFLIGVVVLSTGIVTFRLIDKIGKVIASQLDEDKIIKFLRDQRGGFPADDKDTNDES